jgi:putative DeoR family transcriptional regulator (stage III sporulation protein D)
MKDIYSRSKQLAIFIIVNNSTIRATAKEFGMAKSTVHYDVSYRLKKIDYALFLQVQKILKVNFEEKHIRGGLSTKSKYELLKNKTKSH